MSRIGINTHPFKWHVVLDGYQWAAIDGRAWLSPVSPIGTDRKLEIYQPLVRYTGLFRDFAALDPTSKDEILAFASKYGLLGEHQLQPLNGEGYSMESGAEWGATITAMKRAVDIWDAVQAYDRNLIKKHIQWNEESTGVNFVSDSQQATIASKVIDPELLPRIAGDSYKAAQIHLQSEVNKALVGQTSPTLLWNQNSQLELFNIPKSLLGAMWLQLALAISGNRKYETCAWCGSQFDISAYRKGKKTCSDSCRNLLSRHRRKSNET